MLTSVGIYGNFVTGNNPSISNEIANGASSEDLSASHQAADWPCWNDDEQLMLNLNQTGGVPYTAGPVNGVGVTQFRGPGLRNELAVVDARAWEGGRGERCEFWREVGSSIPV